MKLKAAVLFKCFELLVARDTKGLATTSNQKDLIGTEIFLYTCFFYKQPVYKQLVLGWQIANQLLGLNPLLLSNNKTTD